MNKELPTGWTIEHDKFGFCIISVPTEPHIRYQRVEPDYSNTPVLPVHRLGDPLIIPPPPEDIGKLVEEEITKSVLIMRDYAIAPISPDKLIYYGVSSVGVNPMVHNPTHIVLENNADCVSVALIPIWKPIGNYLMCFPPGGSSAIVYNLTNVVQRKKAENKVDIETYANAYDEKARAAAVEAAFNRLQNIIDEGKFKIHVFVKDLEDMIFFEETESVI